MCTSRGRKTIVHFRQALELEGDAGRPTCINICPATAAPWSTATSPPPVDLWCGLGVKVYRKGDTPWARVPNWSGALPFSQPFGLRCLSGKATLAPHRGGVRDDIAAPSSTNHALLGLPPLQLRRRCGGVRGGGGRITSLARFSRWWLRGPSAQTQGGSPGRQITCGGRSGRCPQPAGIPVPTTNMPGLDASRTRNGVARRMRPCVSDPGRRFPRVQRGRAIGYRRGASGRAWQGTPPAGWGSSCRGLPRAGVVISYPNRRRGPTENLPRVLPGLDPGPSSDVAAG